MNKDSLKKILDEAVEIYNKFRAPEAVAEITEIKNNRVKVRFRGSFCRTCGIRDWVEDFKYVLMNLGVDNELIEYIEPNDPEIDERIGVFEIRKEGD
ncbi:MAG: hypothetical protein ABWW65_03795 [Thermoprotei archaeon]